MNRIVQYACLILMLGIIASSLAYVHPVFAQPTQTSYTVNLTYLTVQLSYPSEVMPGDSVTVSLQATTKSYVDSVSLTAQVFYADNGSLHQLASATVSNNNNYYASSGSTLSKQIQFTVPQDAPRTSLVAALTEKIQTSSYGYYPAYYYPNYYPAYYNNSSPNCYYSPDYSSYDYGYCTYYGIGFPSYSNNAASDAGVAPLSYIKATTPEYVSLQSEYQMVQQQLAQSQTQNQQLQNTIAQRNATIANLNQQLSSSQTTIGTLELVAAGLAVVAVGVFIAYLGKGKRRTQAKVKGDTEAKT